VGDKSPEDTLRYFYAKTVGHVVFRRYKVRAVSCEAPAAVCNRRARESARENERASERASESESESESERERERER
jgi:hypothetical protein